jgi:hypothetical protein
VLFEELPAWCKVMTLGESHAGVSMEEAA